MDQKRPIRVIVVDDTLFYREVLSGILRDYDDILVVDTACDAYDAREKIKKHNPDVITLDVEMPGMNGLEFLERVMTLRPMPVVVVSTLTGPGTITAIDAMELGAVDCVGKPVGNDIENGTFAQELIEKVRAAAASNVHEYKKPHAAARPDKVQASPAARLAANAPKLIAIGASTGGVETITDILTKLPPNCPPIVMTQHMPPGFTASFAKRLSSLCSFPVYEATSGIELKPGMAVLAPGGRHLKVVRSGSTFSTVLCDDPPMNKHRPSVDVLFHSVALAAVNKSLGVILTGMGNDGAAGLLRMKESGSGTLAEDEASCIVYGMPGSAVRIGAVDEILPLSTIPSAILGRCFA